MYIIDLSNTYAIVMALMFTILFVILGKEFKKSILPGICLGVFLVLILMHTIQAFMVDAEIYKMIITKSITVDAVMIFLAYFAYLWVDDIEAKEKHKKSIDNSLDWFWKKV